MTTLNNINDIFVDIATNHQQIFEIFIGEDYDVAASKKMNHALLIVNPSGASLPNTDNGYTSQTIDYTIKVVDLVNKDLSNQQEVLSDTLSIIKDVVIVLSQNPDYFDLNLNIISDVDFNPLNGVLDTDVTGWETTFTLEFPAKLGYCHTPMGFPTPTPTPCGSASVTNTDSSYNATVDEGDTLVLPDISHIDSDGTPTPTPAQTVFTCTPAIIPTGITYQRPLLTGQLTSYVTGDDGYHAINNPYSVAPVCPISYAKLDILDATPFLTLVSNNAFGNKNRFTDSVGGQDYNGTGGSLVDYVIDHLTGIGWIRQTQGLLTWSVGIANSEAATNIGFSDWKTPNRNEIQSVLDFNITDRWNYAPFNIGTNSIYTSTTNNQNTTQAYYIQQVTSGNLIVSSKTSALYHVYCRNHY
jgi:hypothetical protein